MSVSVTFKAMIQAALLSLLLNEASVQSIHDTTRRPQSDVRAGGAPTTSIVSTPMTTEAPR